MWSNSLSDLKKRSGKTTKQIAEESGVPLGTLNKLFAGQTKDPKLETIRAVVKTLGFTLDDLEETKKASAPSEDDTEAKLDPYSFYEALIQMGFVEAGEDLTDADLRFLLAVGEAIRAWFADCKQ